MKWLCQNILKICHRHGNTKQENVCRYILVITLLCAMKWK